MQPFSGAEFQQRFSQVQGQVQIGADWCRVMQSGADWCREVQRGAEVQIQQSGEVQRSRCSRVVRCRGAPDVQRLCTRSGTDKAERCSGDEVQMRC